MVPAPTSIMILGSADAEVARLRRSLLRRFMMVECARDLDEARQLALRCRFHVLIIVDPTEPWGALYRSLSDGDWAPAQILLVGDRTLAETAVDALRGGAADVLLRPFSTDELVASVKALGESHGPDPGNDHDAVVAPPEYPENWTLEQVKHHHMRRVLEASDGNKSAAARCLDISRKTLERKLRGNNPD